MDANRLITIEELEIGDEILIPSGGSFKYLKVLRAPQKRAGRDSYKAVKCAVNMERKEYKYSPTSPVRTYKHYTPDNNFKAEEFFNIYYKTMWLVKRANN